MIVQRRRYVDAILRHMETKKQLRSRVLARRDALPEDVRARKSAAICARLEQELADALEGAPGGTGTSVGVGGWTPTVAVFASMRSEVDTRAFVDAAYERGWRVCFPCMVREDAGADGAAGAGDAAPSRMAFYRVEREQLEAAQAGFLGAPLRCLACAALERDGYHAVAPDELDAVVVPLVAFDDAGRRLGYGGGNYDQLLPRLRADAMVMGVAFDEQRVDVVPCEPHDVTLPRVVSA